MKKYKTKVSTEQLRQIVTGLRLYLTIEDPESHEEMLLFTVLLEIEKYFTVKLTDRFKPKHSISLSTRHSLAFLVFLNYILSVQTLPDYWIATASIIRNEIAKLFPIQ